MSVPPILSTNLSQPWKHSDWESWNILLSSASNWIIMLSNLMVGGWCNTFKMAFYAPFTLQSSHWSLALFENHCKSKFGSDQIRWMSSSKVNRCSMSGVEGYIKWMTKLIWRTYAFECGVGCSNSTWQYEDGDLAHLCSSISSDLITVTQFNTVRWNMMPNTEWQFASLS